VRQIRAITPQESSRPVSPNPDVTLLYLVKQVELAVRSRLDDAVSRHDLTSLQYTALTVLERKPGLTSAELARNSFVRAQTMAQMTNYLESKNLIRREPDPDSRRQFLLFLTDEGTSVVDELRPTVSAIEADLVTGLSEAQVRQFRTVLRAGRESLGGSPPH
jgi:DNA-binding MarR family transcriptional regulator